MQRQKTNKTGRVDEESLSQYAKTPSCTDTLCSKESKQSLRKLLSFYYTNKMKYILLQIFFKIFLFCLLFVFYFYVFYLYLYVKRENFVMSFPTTYICNPFVDFHHCFVGRIFGLPVWCTEWRRELFAFLSPVTFLQITGIVVLLGRYVQNKATKRSNI